MYLISVYFDQTVTQKLQNYIAEIAKRTGNHFMTDHQVPPHLTISSVEARSAEVLLPHMPVLEEKLKKIPIRFVSVGAFFPGVLYAAPLLDRPLQALSVEVYDAVEGIPEVSVHKFYRPYSWFPHVTLGKTLTKEQMREAFSVMQERFAPFEGTVVSAGLARVNPHVDVWKMDIM